LNIIKIISSEYHACAYYVQLNKIIHQLHANYIFSFQLYYPIYYSSLCQNIISL